MKAKLERDLRIRNQFLRNEIDSIVRKAVLNNVSLPKYTRQRISLSWSVPPQASRFRVHNYCILSARSRSYIRFFRLSRIKLRELALKGMLFGIHKASW